MLIDREVMSLVQSRCRRTAVSIQGTMSAAETFSNHHDDSSRTIRKEIIHLSGQVLPCIHEVLRLLEVHPIPTVTIIEIHTGHIIPHTGNQN